MATEPTKPYMFLILDGSDDANKTADALRVLSTDIHISKNKSDFDNFIETLNVENKATVLIVSGTIGVQLKTDLVNGTKYAKIDSIYIYCHNSGAHRRWSEEIDKIKDVHTTHEELLAALGWVRPVSEQPSQVVPAGASSTATTTTTTSPATNPDGQTPDTTTTERQQLQTKFSLGYDLNSEYHIFRILLKHYVHIPPQPNEKEFFTSLMEPLHLGEPRIGEIMSEFRRTYSYDHPMNSIQRHQCFATTLSHTLTTDDSFLFMACGFLFRDLFRQFQKFKSTTSHQWYCRQMCSKKEVDDIKAHEGNCAMLLSFASATSDQNVATALSNTCTEADKDIRVLFTIKTDSSGEDALPFAKLSELLPNCNQKTDEVVFMMGSFFRIDRVETANNPVTVDMTLCAYDDDGPHRKLFEQYREMYVVKNSCNLLLFSCLLFQLGVKLGRENYINCAETCIPTHSTSASGNNTEVLDAKALQSSHRGEWDETVTTCKASIDLRRTENRPPERALVDIYQQLAKACQEKGQNAESLNYAREGVSVLRWVSADDNDCQVLPFYHMMALAHEKDGKLDKAVASCYRALSIAIQDDVYFQKELGWIYDTLTKLEMKNKHYQLAAGFSEKLLEIRRRTGPEQSTIVGDTCINLGKLYLEMKNIEKARLYFEKALEIYEAIEPPGSIKQMEIEDEITRCKDPIKAEEV